MSTDKIIVKAKSEHGRWRAGIHFSRAGVTLAKSDLTEGQITAIATDPELYVVPAVESEAERATREAAEQAAAEQAAAEQAAAEQAAAEQAAAAKAAAGKKAGK